MLISVKLNEFVENLVKPLLLVLIVLQIMFVVIVIGLSERKFVIVISSLGLANIIASQG